MAQCRVLGMCWLMGMMVACGTSETSEGVDGGELETSPFESRQYVPLPGDSTSPPQDLDGDPSPDGSVEGPGDVESEPDGQEDVLPLPDVLEDVLVEADIQQEDAPSPEPDSTESTNSAAFVNASFPTSMECGSTLTVSLEMRNEGTSNWTWAELYKLGTVDDQDPFHEATREWLPENAVIAPGETHLFTFELLAPTGSGIYQTDWQMVQEDVGWFGDIAVFEIEVSCPVQSAWEFTDELEDEVLATATFIRENSPQFFNLESLPDDEKRAIAYDMMTTAINDLRNKGIETGRCVANPGIPVPDPFHWCSDALVVGPPGEAVTIDIYQSWSAPANPQVLITETNQTGVVTDDLVAMP